MKSSAPPLAGSAVLEQKNRFRTSVASFQLKTVKDLPALPPRHYRIALQQSVQVPFREVFQDAENGLLRSGANILLSPRILVAEKQLKVAKISRHVFLPIQAAKAENHCYYSMLRTESFWDRHYIPSLRRYILKFGCRRPEAIICDNYLGQRRAIHCLCSLCRMEFGEFAPKLPKKDVMNLSTGIMEQRMSRELRAFRNARLKALLAGAKLHLPVDSRHFQRAPRLVPLYTLHDILHRKPVGKTPEAVIDFGAGAINPESSRYTPEVDFAVSEHILKTARMKFPKRTVFTAKFTPQFPAKLSEQELQFAILNYFLCGFNGIWIVQHSRCFPLGYHGARGATEIQIHLGITKRCKGVGGSAKILSRVGQELRNYADIFIVLDRDLAHCARRQTGCGDRGEKGGIVSVGTWIKAMVRLPKSPARESFQRCHG